MDSKLGDAYIDIINDLLKQANSDGLLRRIYLYVETLIANQEEG